MKPRTISLERRHFVMAAGLAGVAASVPLLAAQLAPPAVGRAMLIVSGRVTGAHGKALAGTTLEVWHADERVSATTDADGRFLFDTAVHYRDLQKGMRYRLNCGTTVSEMDLVRKGHLHRDDAGMLRATFGLTVTA
jgi:protocatechuate 3,4-dioxygenase beta subunit